MDTSPSDISSSQFGNGNVATLSGERVMSARSKLEWGEIMSEEKSV